MSNVSGPPSDGGLPAGLSSDRVMRGIIARWSNTTGWVDRDGLPIPDTMLVIGYTTVLRRWKNKRPEYKTEHPLPDPNQLNAAIPPQEWEPGLDGKPRPPWVFTYVVYLVDLKTGALFTYAHDTFGASQAYSLLEEAIAVMRMLRGEHVFPIVHLEKRPWKSQTYGTQMRPHFQIVDWRATGDGSQVLPQSPAPQLPGPVTTAAPTAPTVTPTTAAPAAPAAAPPTTPSASTVLDNTKSVKPVTVGELIADELPWK